MNHTDKAAERAASIAEQLKAMTAVRPKAAFVLGSGWGKVAQAVRDACVIGYDRLRGMPRCGVQGHAGNFVFGQLEGVPVMLVQGRFHLYEGKPVEEVVLPVAVAAELGAQTLILTNAAGGIAPSLRVGDLMLLRDHINLTGRNPLVGISPEPSFPIFVDMTRCYDAKLCGAIAEECAALGIAHGEGVYMQVLGPSYETPAEIGAFRALGADAAGMSTAVEAIYAAYRHMRIAALSCITNAAAAAGGAAIDHAEVLACLAQKQEKFGELIRRIAARL